jgi:hypothetical protein
MRRLLLLLMSMVLLTVGAVPASAGTTSLDGPAPAFWLSDPDGDDANNDTEQFDDVEGSSGSATLNNNGATIKVNATGLEPGHAYTMWVVFFSDQTTCADNGSGNARCNGDDLGGANGITYGAGEVVGGSGNATFVARLSDGSTGSLVPGVYEVGADNEFHIVIRSHGPTIPGDVSDQIHSLDGGCEEGHEVGPDPEEEGDFPVPALPGECGDVQLYVFS